jgi:hypothetical protein
MMFGWLRLESGFCTLRVSFVRFSSWARCNLMTGCSCDNIVQTKRHCCVEICVTVYALSLNVLVAKVFICKYKVVGYVSSHKK